MATAVTATQGVTPTGRVAATQVVTNDPPRSLTGWIRLPSDITAYEVGYLARVDRFALVVLLLTVPLLTTLAFFNGTGWLQALCMSALAPMGLLIAKFAALPPRSTGFVSAIALMFASALLVHFGRGMWTMEMHFSFFVGIALLTIYANPMVVIVAALAVVVHHLVLWFLAPATIFNYQAPILSVAVHGIFIAVETAACVFVSRTFHDAVMGLERIVSRRTERLETVLDTLSEHQRLLAQTSEVAKLGGFEWREGDPAPKLSHEARQAIGYPLDVPVTVRSLLIQLVPSARRRLIDALRSAFRNSESFELELEMKRAEGKRWARVIGKVEQRLGARRVFGAIQDFTEQATAREAALAASHAKSQFLANMSHEVRTPLNGILGMTQLAFDDAEDAQQREYLQLIQLSGQNLLSIVNDVLDLSRIESGHFELERAPYDVRQLINEVVRPTAFRAQTKGLELLCRVDPEVPEKLQGDALRLSQVLNNLLGNAVKFTLTGSIGVRVSVSEDGRLNLAVRDSGIGIAPAKQEAIFEPFVQADGNTNRRFGGTGLGLAISRELVQRMGGDIALRSEAGVGSEFSVLLPMTVLAPPPTVKVARALEVLLVATPGELRGSILQQLEDVGTRVTCIEPTSVSAFETMRFDVLVAPAESWTPALAALNVRTVLLARNAASVVARAKVLTRPVSNKELMRALEDASALEPKAPAPLVVRSARALKILLAEDNPVNAKLASHLLMRMGHTVKHVVDGTRAVIACKEESFDLVLMDMQMPELDGLSATKLIREEERSGHTHVPIVALTANAMASDETSCLEAGMDAYLSKPLRLERLESVLARVAEGAFMTGRAA